MGRGVERREAAASAAVAAGLDVVVLPVAYRDVLEVLVDAGRPLRAGQIVDAVGLVGGASKVEGCGQSSSL